jgi:hypothetical protein
MKAGASAGRKGSTDPATLECGGNLDRIMTGASFRFRVTLRRHDPAAEIYHLKEPQKLPLTVSLSV